MRHTANARSTSVGLIGGLYQRTNRNINKKELKNNGNILAKAYSHSPVAVLNALALTRVYWPESVFAVCCCKCVIRLYQMLALIRWRGHGGAKTFEMDRISYSALAQSYKRSERWCRQMNGLSGRV